MIQTRFDMQQGVIFDLNSGKLKIFTDSRIDLNYCNSNFVLDLRFLI